MKISLITVCYNSEKTIENTIESVYKQTYKNIEYILIDGKSIDNTINMIENYRDSFIKRGIIYKWISDEDNGIYDAINKGIKMSTGEIIGILNSDDFFYDKNVIADIAEKFRKFKIDCCYGNLEYINPLTNKITRKWISKPFKYGLFQKSWTPAHPTFYCKKEIYEKYGDYRTDYKIAADVELMYRFLEKYRIISKYINRNMIVMKKGGVSNRNFKSTYIIIKEMRQAFIDNGDRLNLLKYVCYKLLKIKEFVRYN